MIDTQVGLILIPIDVIRRGLIARSRNRGRKKKVSYGLVFMAETLIHRSERRSYRRTLAHLD